jgi:hypothetical protein
LQACVGISRERVPALVILDRDIMWTPTTAPPAVSAARRNPLAENFCATLRFYRKGFFSPTDTTG